ncbi:uncharacterized protein ACHE_31291S [Aspergillus chevalieri]|uniref:Uncharacterized protein n=1 Tax=Aspergillus chevalieri TaxID=182096 RepID=A0A7R7ZN47_ASPCH|nr:uncharacterized protein ACHE_31291S [Aspergillus chevalieri]BCR87304.1 hypothetical protein ACHE_31291S [Aspergillus chevalieri]
MRWTTENENILWRTIFQTQNLTFELDKVSQAWPGSDKPTPKAIKEKLDKYRRAGNNKVTFSMGPKNVTVTDTASPRTTATPTPTPRKPRTSKKAAAAAIQGSFDATGALTVTSTPETTAGTGAGVHTGRGRGRPRKTVAPALADANTLKNESTPEILDPALKRIKTEESSPGAMLEIQIPVSPDPARFRSDPDKENLGPGVGLRLKRKGAQKAKAPTSATYEEIKKRSVPKRNTRKIKVENTEAYARCGEVVDCKGTCCGEPRCVYCFGEWEDSP